MADNWNRCVFLFGNIQENTPLTKLNHFDLVYIFSKTNRFWSMLLSMLWMRTMLRWQMILPGLASWLREPMSLLLFQLWKQSGKTHLGKDSLISISEVLRVLTCCLLVSLVFFLHLLWKIFSVMGTQTKRCAVSVAGQFNKLVYNYRIRIPERFSLVIRSLLTQEGICFTLKPDFKFLEVNAHLVMVLCFKILTV